MKKLVKYPQFPSSTVKLTAEEAKNIGLDLSRVEDGKIRGKIETRGPWSVITGYKALTIAIKFGKYSHSEEVTIYGPRKMQDIRSAGYGIEGRVSINGVKYSCFDSSHIFEIDGKSYDVAVIIARK